MDHEDSVSMEKQVKIGVVGTGHVGAHTAYALAIQGIADEVVICDVKEKKLDSERQDLFDTGVFYPHRVRVTAGTYEDLAGCDIIINAAGKVDLLIGNNDRTTELRYTVPQTRTWAKAVKAAGFKGIVINVSNPCDVVTREIAKILKLPEGHVFGTGTGLDTARLVAQISKVTDLDPRSISAYMLGEHGNAQFAAWSCVSFNGMPLSSTGYAFDHDDLEAKARQGGWVTFNGKQCTEYAIASEAARLAYCVVHDTKIVTAASALLHGEYGEKDLFIGVPCVIGKNGAEKVVELPLTEEEKEKFHACAESIRKNMDTADHLA
jgi:L-lactate dehydrogenase